jgi:catechol 2,3-dioxygenase-like lactoylglutathione lyase family enzyme
MKRVTGLGGVFIRCSDPEKSRAWYARHLGIPMEPWGATFHFKDETNPEAYNVLSFFTPDAPYFAPSESTFMLNFRVDDLDALLEALRAEGVTIVGEPMVEDYGKFAWILDPDGNKLELWEQV